MSKRDNKNSDNFKEPNAKYAVGSDLSLSTNWEVFRNVKKEGKTEIFSFVSQAKEFGVNKNLYAELLEVNLRTLNRYLAGQSNLDSDKKEKSYRLNKLFIYGSEVIGSKELFSKWLFEENTYLNDKPINFLSVVSGIEIVTNLLGKIDYGVY